MNAGRNKMTEGQSRLVTGLGMKIAKHSGCVASETVHYCELEIP